MGYTRDAMCRIIVEDGVNRMEVCFVMCYLDQSLFPRVGGGGVCVCEVKYSAFILRLYRILDYALRKRIY